MKAMNESERLNLEECSFEKALAQLEEVVQALEDGELTLDEAIEHYRTGMQLAKVCRDKLTLAEQKVEKVLSGEEGLTWEAFEVEEE